MAEKVQPDSTMYFKSSPESEKAVKESRKKMSSKIQNTDFSYSVWAITDFLKNILLKKER